MAPWNYNGTEEKTVAGLDWVLVVVRDKEDPTQVVAQKAVLLKNNGSLINADGGTQITFNDVIPDRYFVSVHHKSHLAVLSAQTYELLSTSVSGDGPFGDLDLSRPNQVMGDNQLKQVSNNPIKYALRAGDYNQDGSINNLDLSLWAQNGAALNQYLAIDADGNAVVNNQDYNLSKRNEGVNGVPELNN